MMMEEEDEVYHSFEEEEGDGEVEGEGEEMSGWADSMSKILKSTKPKNKKELMLSRARKDYEVSKQPATTARFKKGDDLEIAKIKPDEDEGGDEDGDIKKEEGAAAQDPNILSMKQQRKLELRQRKLDAAWENLNRLTNEAIDKEMEVDLLKVATKGVVQLFNAVSQQQKSLKTKLRASSKSEFQKEKVMAQSKDLFDNAMKKNKMIGRDNDEDPEIKEESSSDEEQMSSSVRIKRGKRKVSGKGESGSSKKSAWPALHDDFMLGAKLKDWDKDSESD